MKYSEDLIDRIRSSINIVDLIGDHVKLRKRGQNWIGLCPFHSEKTPSFNVQEEKGIFKCFGCGKGGDVFSYLMESESLTFPESIEKLAQRAGIELAKDNDPEGEARHSERESIHGALLEAARYYYLNLRKPESSAAMSYLRERGLEPETLKRFGIGYAQEYSGPLIDHLSNLGYSDKIMEGAGLVARGSNNNELYERFRGRIIFPVRAATGKILGFGGRILPGGKNSELAKYINSPDTSVYHKSQVLYGLFQAKEAIRKKDFAILVEGNVDVLATSQGGFENVIAASGTALTPDQLNLLRRYTKNIVLLFDADTAGKNATMRGIEIAIEAGLDVSTVVLPKGEDPDSYIRNFGSEGFDRALSLRQSFIESKAQLFDEQGMLHDPAKATIAIRSIVETISKVPDAIKRELFIRRLSERFHLREATLLTELQTALSNAAKTGRFERTATEQPADGSGANDSYHEELHTDFTNETLTGSERVILESLLESPLEVAEALTCAGFDLSLIKHSVASEIIASILAHVESGDVPSVGELMDESRAKPEWQRLILDSSIKSSDTSEDRSSEGGAGEQQSDGRAVHSASQAVALIMRNRDEERLGIVMDRLRRMGKEDDPTPLLEESSLLAKRIQELKDLSSRDEYSQDR